MSDDFIAVIIPLAALAIIFAWVPLLNLICPPCGRALERRYAQGEALKMRSSMSSIPD
jgi:hypothetical protein